MIGTWGMVVDDDYCLPLAASQPCLVAALLVSNWERVASILFICDTSDCRSSIMVVSYFGIYTVETVVVDSSLVEGSSYSYS